MEACYNFLKKFKIFDICTDDIATPALAYVHFIDGYAYASNRFILVRVPLSICTTLGEDDYKRLDGFCIRGSLLKTLMQYESVAIDYGYDLDDKGETFDYVELTATVGQNELKVVLKRPRVNPIVPPNFEKIITEGRESEVPVSSIGFRIKFLRTLAAAMGQDIIFLRFTKTGSGKIYVIPDDETAAGTIGVIMPVYRDGELPFDNQESDEQTRENAEAVAQ